jgi:hypothetical protein
MAKAAHPRCCQKLAELANFEFLPVQSFSSVSVMVEEAS